MRAAFTGADWRGRWGRVGALVSAIVLCVLLIVFMAWLVLRELEELGTANSDNVQWSLAQVDVEFLRFSLAVARAEQDPASLPALRRRFDIFYSRMATLKGGEVFRPLREIAEFEAARGNVMAFLQKGAARIDGPDPPLIAGLPDLARQAQAVGGDVRGLSLSGLAAFAKLSDARREQVMETLIGMALVLVVLFCGLAVLSLSLLRLYRLSEARAREVQQTGARMQAIVAASLDAIVVCDRNGRIVEVNQVARRIFDWPEVPDGGAPPADAAGCGGPIGASFIDHLFAPEEVEPLRAGPLRFIETGRRPAAHRRRLEAPAISRSGRRFPVEVSIDSAEGEAGRVHVAFLRDISRRRAAEDELTSARDRALAGQKAKAEFLAVMSHEMRTPLNGLLGTMQMLQDTALSDRQRGLLDRMHSSGRLLLGLVNDVLDLSKFEAGKMQAERRAFSLPQLLDRVVETTSSLAAANRNALGWRWTGPPRDTVAGDPGRLRQVLINLVGNAVKFTRDGRVAIEVELAEGGGDLVEIRVRDTGIGIAPADLARIFEDFETVDSSYARKAGGTGLGLGIVNRLVALMGGQIAAESTLGEGSLFRLRLPLPAAAPEEAMAADRRPAAAPAAPARPLQVLLVEDNEINRFVARGMLEAEGHAVTEAVDGRAGVAAAAVRRFDVILMDISMPVMDGQQAARAIRAGGGTSAGVPIVAVTAHALPEEVRGFRAAGMERCISKPIDRADLSATLREIGAELARAPPGGGGSAAPPPAPAVPPGLRVAGPTPATAAPPAVDSPVVEAEPLLDEAQIDDLRGCIGPADLLDLLEGFLAETGGAVARLAGTAEAGPAEAAAVARLAHKCAGSCATFGLVRLRRTLGRIEAAAKREAAVPEAALRALPPLWSDSRAVLSGWQARHGLQRGGFRRGGLQPGGQEGQEGETGPPG